MHLLELRPELLSKGCIYLNDPFSRAVDPENEFYVCVLV
jgi:hypothetical protein